MAEPLSKENERLAARLISIGKTLQDGANPPAGANGAKPAGPDLYEGAFWQTADGHEVRLHFAGLTTAVGRELHRLEQRIDALEKRKGLAPLAARLAGMEAKMLTNGGIWKADTVFQPGEVVTHDGSAWVCQEANSNVRPGQSDAWRLMVKSKGRR